MKHKHAELIKAWADGAEIEALFFNDARDYWSVAENPAWSNVNLRFRIKPEPKPDAIKYVSVKLHWHTKGIARWDNVEAQFANLKIVFNGETGELKSAEVLK